MDLTNTLLVDIGNTNTKIRANGRDSIIVNDNFDTSLIPPHQNAIISCVAHHQLLDNFNNPIIAKTQDYKDIEFNYNLDELGIDRYLAIIAGYEVYSANDDIVIIDIGTFITTEYIHNNEYISGGIAPGLEKLKNIHTFTGKDSKGEWIQGTLNMFTNHILQQINEKMNLYEKIIITGGNMEALESLESLIKIKYRNYKNKDTIIFTQNLVLDGLKFYTQYFLK